MTPETAKHRARLLTAVRTFFARRDVLEVETPILAQASAVDCHIDLFTAAAQGGHDSTCRFLQTSPELHMKRLLTRGYPDIYQLARVFRSDERGRLHNPEFTMVEWYRRGFSMLQLMHEVAELCRKVLGDIPVSFVDYRELFVTHTGIDPLAASLDDIQGLLTARDSASPRFESRSDALQYALSVAIEPKLARATLCFIHSYPAEQAILARLDPDDPRVSRRFELFYNGTELANGWEELLAPDQNRDRFEAQNSRRRRRGKPPIPLDERFLTALDRGAPACAGVALGFDRLMMHAVGADRLEQVIAFPWDEA